MIESREWVFRVSCKVEEGEQVCIVGNCSALGNWDSQKAIPLTFENSLEAKEDCDEKTFSTSIQIPQSKVEYRHFVCIILEARPGVHERAVIVRRWETSLLPRKIPDGVTNVEAPTVEKFGLFNGGEQVDQGWLVKESVVQFRLCKSPLYNDPIMLFKRKYKDKKVRIKITPVELHNHSPGDPPGTFNGTFDDSSDLSDLSTLQINSGRPTWPITEVAVMNEGQCCFQQQQQFGVVCNNGEYIVIQCQMLNTASNAFLCDFYMENDEEIPQYLGCSYILPSNLKDNYGVVTLPITSQKHMPVGQLTVHYMVVLPMDEECDMTVSYARYWKDTWKGLEVGHRGAGNSYHSEPKSCANIRENTIASLKYAAEIGADMVEFDVQLSKDYVPVIYHDFHACIALKRKKEQDQTDLLEIPIKDLTMSQLQALKDLSHLKEGVPCDVLSYCDRDDMVYHKTERGFNRFSDDEFEDHQPFPTLQRAMETVPHTCGFNIEVKWTMQLRDGTYELQHPFELNNFLDLIIKLVLQHSGKRKIVFSCFHPDICTMLRLKQNRYPVMFLTQGISEEWPPYEDQRTSTIRDAILYATNADILGINVHTEDIMRDPSQMTMALDYGLIVFCWGDHNNDQENIKFLKGIGLHGIIYDKIDVYNTKKESVFLCEEREADTDAVIVESSSLQNMETYRITSNGAERPEMTFSDHSCSPIKNCSGNCSPSSPTSFTGILTN